MTPPVTTAASRARVSAYRRVPMFVAAGAVALATLPLAGHVDWPEAAVALALYVALATLTVGGAHAHLIEVLAHEASVAISRTALSPARSAR